MEETAAWSATHRLEYKIWLMLLCCMYLHNNVFCISCHNQRLCMYTCCLTNDTVGYAYDVVNLNIISPRLSLILSLRYSQRFIRLSRTMTVCWIVCDMRHHEMRDTAFALPWSIYTCNSACDCAFKRQAAVFVGIVFSLLHCTYNKLLNEIDQKHR